MPNAESFQDIAVGALADWLVLGEAVVFIKGDTRSVNGTRLGAIDADFRPGDFTATERPIFFEKWRRVIGTGQGDSLAVPSIVEIDVAIPRNDLNVFQEPSSHWVTPRPIHSVAHA